MQLKKVTWLTDKYHYIREREKGKAEEVPMTDKQAQHLVDNGIIKTDGFKKSGESESTPKK